MPQLSPMSWVMVISVFLVCLIFFAVTTWWATEGKYSVKYVGNKSKSTSGKKLMKWSFGGGLLK
uniref:ATP synthase F0 subunit 8 n=1 Tax=Cristaria plicata TaxID=165446 RepID=C4PKV9_CRIPL|nr:ATP synthase F0 subunit 8 [Cristaria plicata]ACQ90997.1 ATP synthase F0 subunit 8 [Cristaria plicata]ADE08062.1 ATP synthase F0 subunit 8 [Cristaria plicata]AIM46723.1 ATP synthase F0 subunit 8 [Cristaria plicata]